jgi:signal transduction histidine kinase
MATPLVALLFLFPNGKFVPLWTRWALIVSIPWNIIAFLIPYAYNWNNNLTGVSILFGLWIVFPGLGIYAQIFRYRRVSTHDERQQTKWVLFGFALWTLYILISTYPYFYLTNLPPGAQQPWWTPISELSWWFSVNILPVTLAVAIMRSRLWNIDIVINRTLVYGALTLITMTLYILVVGTLGSLLNIGDNSLIAFLTTGLVAVLFQPLRDRLQGWVNRMMYGERDDPVAVLSKLGEHLESTGSPEDALVGITETVASTLKLPYVAIELGKNGDIAAAYGVSRYENIRLPLLYQSETSGYLVVARRSPGESFNSSELQLLENIARQAGAAAQAVKLTADLRHSRQRLVTTREEERRRFRRDLHDGLGPTLASLTLKLDAARNLFKTDPDKAESLIDDLKKQTQETIQDIRTLVYDLRPPALDELGLAGAIQSFIDKQQISKPRISFEMAGDVPQLPAAYEVAVYRITLEGITNVLRHANADKATVRIALLGGELLVELWDDGSGLEAEDPTGVGLASMKERAEELGGSFELLPRDCGVHIRACLPLLEE